MPSRVAEAGPDLPPPLQRIEGEIGRQHRLWRIQRIGWALMSAFVAAAALGLLGGGGPFARGAAEVEGLDAEWPRFPRLGLTEPLRLTLPAEPGATTAELHLPAGFTTAFRLHATMPPARETVVGPAGVTLRLPRDAAGGAKLVLHLEPLGAAGPRRLRVETSGRALDMPMFVWP